MSIQLILYSKPGCHLCEGLQEKLIQIQNLDFELEVRDITTRDDWFQAYQYEIPVLVLKRGEEEGSREPGVGSGGVETGEAEGAGEAGEVKSTIQNQNSELHPSSFILHPSSFTPLPRPSPRATVQQLEQMLRKYI